MRTFIIRSSVVAMALCAPIATTAFAETVEAKIPFAFVVNGQTLPAGTYRFERDASDPAVIVIRHDGHKAETAAVLSTTAADGRDPAGETPAVTFAHRGATYRLVDIWDSTADGRAVLTR